MSSYLKEIHNYQKITQIRQKILAQHSLITLNTTINRHPTHTHKLITNNSIDSAFYSKDKDISKIETRIKQLDLIKNKIRDKLCEKKLSDKYKIKQIKQYGSLQKRQNINNFETRLNIGYIRLCQSRNIDKTNRQQIKLKRYQSKQNIKIIQPIINFTQQEIKLISQSSINQLDINQYISQERQKLISLLLKQIKYDSILRIQISKYKYCQLINKYQSLKKQILILDPILEQDIDKWIHIFQSLSFQLPCRHQEIHLVIKNLAKSFIEAKKHWQNELKEGVSILKLEKQYFTIGEIDIAGKGYIQISDLLNFLNLNLSKEIQTQQLQFIFKRMKSLQFEDTNEGRLSYITFLNLIAK